MGGPEFSWLLAAAIFLSYVALDAAYVIYTSAVASHRAFVASFSATAIYALSAFGAMTWFQQPLYIVPMLLGAWIGTYTTVKFTARKRRAQILPD
jgi:uncharacterized membrane protein YfcA